MEKSEAGDVRPKKGQREVDTSQLSHMSSAGRSVPLEELIEATEQKGEFDT